MLKVLLTGATGFIGSHVARQLLHEGHEVFVWIRPGSDTWRISDLLGSLRVVPRDSSAPEAARSIAAIQPELCIHLAWCAKPGEYLTSPSNLDCLSSTLHLVEHVAAAGGRRFVGVGTCLEYDTDFGYLSESTPTAPRSLYAASKLAACVTSDHLGKLRGMAVAWTRVFCLYGPAEDERRLIPYVISSLLQNQEARVTNGDLIRDYLHVQDVASAILAVARSEVQGPINVGSGRPVALRELVTKIGDLLDRRHLVAFQASASRAAGPVFVCADNRLLRQSTSWTPRYDSYDLEPGLQSAIEWWRGRMG